MRRTGRIACGAAGAGVIAVAHWVVATPMAGCTTHQCDKSCTVLGGPPFPDCVNQGPKGDVHMEGAEQVWESSAPDGMWLDFPGQRTYRITYPQPFACPPELSAQVAADVNKPQNNWVSVGGSLVEYFDSTATGTGVINPACAAYGLRIVARGIPTSSPFPWCVDGGVAARGGDAVAESGDDGPGG